VARKQGYDAVITISNDLTMPGEHPISIDGRRLQKVALRHLSWAEIVYEAHVLCHHEGVANPAHLWLLTELLHYLRHDNSGCKGFDNMGPAWVPVREAVIERTLHPAERKAIQVAECWEKAVRQLCLRLAGELGTTVAPVTQRRKAADPAGRKAEIASMLAESGRLTAKIRIPGPASVLDLVADLRASRIEASVDLAAPLDGRPLTKVRWLIRQLDTASPDLRIETLIPGRHTGPRELLKQLRAEEAQLIPEGDVPIIGFRLTSSAKLGTKRGPAETGFIRSVDALVDDMFTTVIRRLRTPASSALNVPTS
jgi:hypothetical protein